MLLAWDRQGNVVATLDHMVARDEDGNVVGLIDFEAHELAGGAVREIADFQSLDASVPKGIAKKYLGHDPQPDEVVILPPDEPFRIVHDQIAGAGTWPEWLGGGAHAFRVDAPVNRRPVALVHRKSGHRRERAAIEAAIAERIAKANGKPADIRDLVGGPDRPLLLDEEGKTMARLKVARPNLPIVGRQSA